MPKKKPAASLADMLNAKIVAEEKDSLSTEAVLASVASGELVDRAIDEMKRFGKNEIGDPLRWNQDIFEQALRAVMDLRITAVGVSGCSQFFKRQRYSELIATSKGYKQAKDIKRGDLLISVEGTPTKVIGVHPGDQKYDFYKVTFKDGSSVETCAEHWWEWYSPGASTPSRRKGRPPMRWVNTTKELYDDAMASGGFRQTKKNGKPGRYKYAIPMLEGPAQMDNGFDCAGLSPYLLGLLIGDGSYGHGSVTYACEQSDFDELSRLTQWETGKLRYRDAAPNSVYFSLKGLMPALKNMGIAGQTKQAKRIPSLCQGMHWEKRLELLRGLMDSDGTNNISSSGKGCGAVYTTVVPELAEQVADLVRNLAGYAVVRQYEHDSYTYKNAPNKTCIFYQVHIQLPETMNPFKLSRKAEAYGRQDVGKQIKAIESIELVEPSDGVCFTVEHPRALYLMNNGIVSHNTAICAQSAAYLSQRGGLRTIFAFPKQQVLQTLQPMQHAPLLRNWASVSGVDKITSNMRTSSSVFNVGRGSAYFTYLNSGSGETAAGSSVVAVTGDILFVEEASQSPNAAIFPLYRRLDKGRITEEFEVEGPKRLLGTPGNGAGIEAIIDGFTYNFWAHAWCEECQEHHSLHPQGALMKSTLTRNSDGQLVEKWTDAAGMPLDWHHHDPENKIKSAYIGCPKCGTEFKDEHRAQPTYKCIHTGWFLEEFLKNYVPQHWKTESISLGLWVPALGRPGNGRRLARAILKEFVSPDVVEDLYQQRLGIPSSFVGGAITAKKIIEAIERPLWTPTTRNYGHNQYKTTSLDEVVRVLGVDQGRSANYYAVVEYLFRKNSPIPLQYANARRNILYLAPATISDLPDLIDEYKIDVGAMDHAPNITMASQIEEDHGIRSFAQKPLQIPDFKDIQAHDGGLSYEIVGIRDRKFGRGIFNAFDAEKFSISEEYAYQIDEPKRSDSIFKHLTGVTWNNEEGKVERAKDKVDDLFFALMFAEAAFAKYLEDPSSMTRDAGWDWFNSM